MKRTERDFQPCKEGGVLRRAREEHRTVDAIQLLMRNARQLRPPADPQAPHQGEAAGVAQPQEEAAQQQQQQRLGSQPPGFSAPCTHCQTLLNERELRQCASCQDVFCAPCSVMDYSLREDRVFCLECLDNQGTSGFAGGGAGSAAGGSCGKGARGGGPWLHEGDALYRACSRTPLLQRASLGGAFDAARRSPFVALGSGAFTPGRMLAAGCGILE